MTNELIIGGGAIGQVFGLHLAKGGARVSYVVRSAQVERARAGFELHRLRRTRAPTRDRFVPDRVFDSVLSVDRSEWSSIWLCVPSTALRESWIESLRDRIGASPVVCVGQDLRDRSTLQQHWSAQQIVQVPPAVFAYDAPLPGRSGAASGTAYWMPPGSSAAVSGHEREARRVVDLLTSGGMRARYVDTVGKGEMAAALSMPHIALLEAREWSLRAARTELAVSAAASREACSVVAAVHGVRPSRAIATSPFLARAALAGFSRLAPFDLESYARAHFTKTGAQTRLMLEGWIAECNARGLAVVHLQELRDALSVNEA